MPDLDCLNKDMVSMKVTLSVQTKQFDELVKSVAENTAMTQEIIDMLKWVKMTRAFILWVATPIGAMWGAFEWVKLLK